MPNWEELFEDYLDDLVRVAAGGKVQFTVREARTSITNFISTEIIEKLIADIPDKYYEKDGQGATHLKVNLSSIKQQLRDKWLAQ